MKFLSPSLPTIFFSNLLSTQNIYFGFFYIPMYAFQEASMQTTFTDSVLLYSQLIQLLSDNG